ncbi:MAG: DUF370 domain-containing protein [Clostridiales bacterium]|nr:DUF370 domain-containing protein [Clostridiales bacterium]
MYLHLGQDTVVSSNDIIGIFDIENTTVSKPTRDFLAKAEKNGEVFNVSYELPKSFVLCRKKDGGRVIYISQISCSTLLKRTNL